MSLRRAAFLFATPLVYSACALASEPGSIDRTLNISGPVTLEIQSGPGGIHITSGSSSTVVIHAVIRSTFGRADLGLAEANILALQKNPPIEQNGNVIRVGYVNDEGMLKGVSVTYDIQTPRETQVHATADAGGIRIDGVHGAIETVNRAGETEVSNVEATLKMTAHSGGIVVRNSVGDVVVRNDSGGIQLQGVHGGVDAVTGSGRIEVGDITGNVQSTTRSASIRLNNVKGSVDAHSSSGSIEVLQLTGAAQVETASGSIRIAQISPAPIRVLSRSGAIRVELAAGGGYNLEAQSEKGKISGTAIAALPRTKDEQHSFRHQIGSGGPLVHLDTRSSKIEID